MTGQAGGPPQTSRAVPDLTFYPYDAGRPSWKEVRLEHRM